MTRWRMFRYKNLTLFFFSLLFALFLSKYEPFHLFLIQIGEMGYIGAFFAGILFVSTFTVATSAVVLLVLAESISPVEIGIIAGLGAVLGDLIIFRFVKNSLLDEVVFAYNQIDGTHHLIKILHTKYFAWTLPVIGAIIIASPFPDEVGVSLMGISKMKPSRFLFLSFILNTIGIFLIVSASAVIKP